MNSRLAAQGIPVSCEVDIYGALSEFIGTVVSQDAVTLLDINNSVPADMYAAEIGGTFDYTQQGIPSWPSTAATPHPATGILRDEVPEDYGKDPSGRSNAGYAGG